MQNACFKWHNPCLRLTIHIFLHMKITLSASPCFPMLFPVICSKFGRRITSSLKTLQSDHTSFRLILWWIKKGCRSLCTLRYVPLIQNNDYKHLNAWNKCPFLLNTPLSTEKINKRPIKWMPSFLIWNQNKNIKHHRDFHFLLMFFIYSFSIMLFRMHLLN